MKFNWSAALMLVTPQQVARLPVPSRAVVVALYWQVVLRPAPRLWRLESALEPLLGQLQ